MARTYKNELQNEVDSLKTSTKKIDERYDNKFEILSEKINSLKDKFKKSDKNMNQNRADVDVMLEDLRVEIQNLKGNIEESNHSLNLFENSTNKSLNDLDGRIVELENKLDIILAHLSKIQKALGVGEKSGSKDSASNDISEYDSIIKLITEGKKYDRAKVKLRGFIQKFPKSTLVDNAQYWLAECYYAKSEFGDASVEFAKLVNNYPSSEKKCGALLKGGFSYEKLNKSDKSTQLLKRVIRQCPETTEAKMAGELLSAKNPAKKSKTSR